jgi:hypothetical protein
LVVGRGAGCFELRFLSTRQVRGIVVRPPGVAAGVGLTFVALAPFLGGAAGTSGIDGYFYLDLPREVASVLAVASAFGFAVRASEASLIAGPL